jgi:hypothetical protein
MMLLLALLACDAPESVDTGATDTDTGAPDTEETDTEVSDPPDTDTGAWPSTLSGCDAVERDTGGERPDCAQTLVWGPSCDADPGPLSRAGLLYESGDSGGGVLGGSPVLTITDAGSWDALVAAWPYGTAPSISVDFETHIVVILQYAVSSSCGMGVTSHGVVLSEAYAARVYARFEDRTGSCAMVCDVSMEAVVAYAVPRENGYPEVCGEVIQRCEG